MKPRFTFGSRNKIISLAVTALLYPSALAWAGAPMQKVQSGYFHTMLGKFEITAISDGTIDLPVDKLLAEAPKDTQTALKQAFLDTPTETSDNAFLINTGERLVLVDAGAGPLFGPTLGKLARNIQAAGYQLDQIDDVVLTHLHPDHVGGLMTAGKMTFPKATIHADKADTDYWLSEDNKQKNSGSAEFFAGAMASLNAYVRSGQLKPFMGETEVAPGIKAVVAHGHTPGHVVYEVQSDGKRLLLIGDLIHVGAVQFDKPSVTIHFDTDEKEAGKVRRQFFANLAETGDLIGAAHLSFPGLGRIRTSSGKYDWFPINYTTKF